MIDSIRAYFRRRRQRINVSKLTDPADVAFYNSWSKVTDVSVVFCKGKALFCLGLVPDPGF